MSIRLCYGTASCKEYCEKLSERRLLTSGVPVLPLSPSMFAEEDAYLRQQSCFTIGKRPTTEPELHAAPHSQKPGQRPCVPVSCARGKLHVMQALGRWMKEEVWNAEQRLRMDVERRCSILPVAQSQRVPCSDVKRGMQTSWLLGDFAVSVMKCVRTEGLGSSCND
jgi:hypothetical protein